MRFAEDATGPAQKLADLPIKTGPGDYHDTRDVAISKDGSSIFVSVGSGSNIDDPDRFLPRRAVRRCTNSAR